MRKTMVPQRNSLAGLTLGLVLASTVIVSPACGGDDGDDVLGGVDAIVFIQRPKRNEMGDIFQYTSYKSTARIVKLSPPTADGQLTVLCCDKAGPEYATIDISSYDLSFDAREIVFSGKLTDADHYGLFVLTLEDGQVEQLASDPSRDYVSPIFLPGDKIAFTTNAIVEEGAPQHRDEYERGVTLQLGVMNRDGTGEKLGARNLSHRVFPSLASDGRIMFTQWDHLGPVNAGHLTFVNPDLSQQREAFGKEGTGVSNSYLKAVEIAPGRYAAIATARDRTIQAGALIDIRLGFTSTAGGVVRADDRMSEANATYRILTPNVPLDRGPSTTTVGRYYDVAPLDAGEYPNLLVSWSDGPVESETLGAAGLSADFGVFLYDSKNQVRRPIWNDPEMWDVFAKPLRTRTAPPVIASSGANEFSTTAAVIGSLDAYRSSIANVAEGSVYGVRVMEGFSSEEGFPMDFGTKMFEGHAQLGVAPLASDNSWAALIPANVPVHVQLIDKFGMSIVNEPVWQSAGPGEMRMCGGCHESRSEATVVQPGPSQALINGPVAMLQDTPRVQRVSTSYTRDTVRGVPWDGALQTALTAKCAGCHNGTPGPANPSYTITDPETGASASWTFDLTDGAADLAVGDFIIDGFSKSYISLVGLDDEAIDDANVVVTGNYVEYMRPMEALTAPLFQKLNPPQQFPTQNSSVRAFAGSTHATVAGFEDLTADEYYLLILANEMGVNFYSRENAPLDAYQP